MGGSGQQRPKGKRLEFGLRSGAGNNADSSQLYPSADGALYYPSKSGYVLDEGRSERVVETTSRFGGRIELATWTIGRSRAETKSRVCSESSR